MKTGIYLLSLAAIFITACGGDSGTEKSLVFPLTCTKKEKE